MTFANPILEEVHQGRKRIAARFGGDARAYCRDVIARSKKRTARNESFSGETLDVENPGQGKTPWADPVVEEVHEARRHLSQTEREKAA